jgi:hypothetical protein
MPRPRWSTRHRNRAVRNGLQRCIIAQVTDAILGKQARRRTLIRMRPEVPCPPRLPPASTCGNYDRQVRRARWMGRVRGQDLYLLPALVIRQAARSLVRSGSHDIALIGIDLGSPCVRSSGG